MNNAHQPQLQHTEPPKAGQAIVWFPKFKHILGAMLFCWVVTSIFGIILGFLLALAGIESEQMATFIEIITMAFTILTIAIVLWWGTKKSHLPSHEIYQLRPLPLNALFILALIAFPLSILISEVDNCVIMVFPRPEWVDVMFAKILGGKGVINFTISLISLMLIAPIMEELLFRGFFNSGLQPRYGKVKSLILTSFCFGIFHLIPWQALGAALIGMVLHFVYYATGSLRASIILHALLNGMVFIAFRLRGVYEIPGYTTDPSFPMHTPLIWLVPCAIVFGFGMYWFYKHPQREA